MVGVDVDFDLLFFFSSIFGLKFMLTDNICAKLAEKSVKTWF